MPKDWPIKKETTFEFSLFTTLFGQFFANYIQSHYREVARWEIFMEQEWVYKNLKKNILDGENIFGIE